MSKLYNFLHNLLPEKMSGNNMTKNQLLAKINELTAALNEQKEQHANEINLYKKTHANEISIY